MKIRVIPIVPRNALTSVRSLQGPHLTILDTRDSSGKRPSGVHLCLKMVISCLQMMAFVPEKVPPEYFMCWMCYELCCFFLYMFPLPYCRSLHVFLYYHKSCISIFWSVCSALIYSFYLSIRFSLEGCAWFPSRVQQFLCQMMRSLHHASTLHCALHCSALVWDCLGLWISI